MPGPGRLLIGALISRIKFRYTETLRKRAPKCGSTTH